MMGSAVPATLNVKLTPCWLFQRLPTTTNAHFQFFGVEPTTPIISSSSRRRRHKQNLHIHHHQSHSLIKPNSLFVRTVLTRVTNDSAGGGAVDAFSQQPPSSVSSFIYVCVCTHTHTHIYIYIYIYIKYH